MTSLEGIYRRSPVAVQNLMATAFGARERVLRYRGEFAANCRDLERSQWDSREALAAAQSARLRAMVAFCSAQVPFYRQQFADLGLVPADIRTVADLEQLPVLTKEEVRSNPDAFRPEGLRERAVAQTTGGTTGTPLRYWVTPSAMQYTYATYEVRFRRWAGVAFGDRMASINGRKIVPIEQDDPPFWRHNLAFNQLYLSPYHLTEAHVGAYADQLARFDPVVIVGYVSSVHLLANHLLATGSVGKVSPRAVLVSSETLFPWIRADIEAAFGCKVYDGYGLGELSAFISECPSGTMHISPEYGVVEAVPIDGEDHLVATGLFNRAMPLLRYDTGDVVELGDPDHRCPCGRELPTVARLVGRADDYVATPDGRRVGPAPLSLAFQGIRGVREAQIHQRDEGRATVLLAVTAEYGHDEQSELERELRARLGSAIHLDYEQVNEIPRTAWGKRRLVDSTIARRATEPT